MGKIMKEKVLVSIIVPAYNVKKYIEKCLNSICQQSYKNLDIIIVDDGSSDGTSKIIDEKAREDGRIRVIHIVNSGVSAARNIGIRTAKGEYLIFVDADDYLAIDCVEYMMKLACRSNADFCLSKNCFTQKNDKQIKNDLVMDLMPEDATALLLSPEVIVGCWNKIFKKSFLDANNLYFSTSLFYGEGLFFITQAAQLSNRITVGNKKVYYYRRNNEMSATTKFDIEKLRNGEKALYMIMNNVIKPSEQVLIMWKLHICMFYLGAVTKIRANKCKDKYDIEYKHWLGYIRKNYVFLFKSRCVSNYRKALLFGGCISPLIMARLDLIRRKKIERNSFKE